MTSSIPYSHLFLIGFLLATGIPTISSSLAAPPRLPRILWTQPPRPPNLGEPGGRGQGGGSRGDCTAYKDATILLPRSSPWALTTQAHPTLWLHAPKGLAAKVPLEFVVQDAQNKTLFKTFITPAVTPAGVIPIAFPQDAPALQPNQRYQWKLSIYCDAEVPDQPIQLQGTIERTTLSPELTASLEQSTTPIEKAEFYAKNGIWHDAVTTLGMARLYAPSYPLTIAWKDLLRQAELNAIITAPIWMLPF